MVSRSECVECIEIVSQLAYLGRENKVLYLNDAGTLTKESLPYFSGSGGFEKVQAINDGINQLFLERLSAVKSKTLKIFLERNKEKIK